MKTKTRLAALLALSVCVLGPVRAGLVYYLPFDQSGSASLSNLGSQAGTATAVDGPGSGAYVPSSTTSVLSAIGGTHAWQFTGNGSSAGAVVLPDSTSQFSQSSSSAGMTLSTWVYWNGALASGQFSGIANKLVSSSKSGWGLSITDAGELRFEYGTGTALNNRKSAVGAITTGQWVNVVVTWNAGSTSALNFYVNGASTPPTTTFTGSGVLGANTESIRLGATSSTMYNSLNGSLDDFAMWDSVLTAAQARALSTAPTALTGYNASVMNQLFNVAAGSISSATIDGLTWTSITGLDVSGRTLGDTWTDGGDYFIWLSGSGGSAAGLIASAIPEPGSFALLAGLAGLAFVSTRRRRRVS
ncbi:MAG TPA: LamG domain-containing protein [Rariglobus sp.]